MLNKKLLALITLTMLVISALAVPVSAQSSNELTVIGKLAIVEKTIYGASQTGALVDRVNKLEHDIYGKETREAVLPRVDKLYTYAQETSQESPSLMTRLNAVEWMLTHSVSDSPIKTRIENLEKVLNGSPSTGPLEERLSKLLKVAYTEGQFEVAAATLPKDTLIKIKTLSTLNSKQSRVGDTVALGVAEDVFIGGVLIIPKGARGTGKVVKVEPSRNFGRDAKLEISFNNVAAADGSLVDTFLGEKAKEQTKSMAKAAGASVAGMVIFGPVGIIGGAFVNGNDVSIPIGTQMYIQTKDNAEIYGIKVK
ncbi:hypothetical protein SCACP_32310 [Sporomusa carbonis]|uniref:hypothetical protein n=1 Tax=Sporomusa carbonis TaxID=3076075 RepID=UPI003A781EB8